MSNCTAGIILQQFIHFVSPFYCCSHAFFVKLLWLGLAVQYDGMGSAMVHGVSTATACRHGWRYYKAKTKLAS